MFQLAGNLSGLTARLRRGRSHGRACDKPGLGKNAAGARVGGFVATMEFRRLAGARVRGFAATIEFRRLTPSTSDGKSKVRPPCVVIRLLRSYYVRIIKVFQLKCMVP